jgi:hypothetical protein
LAQHGPFYEDGALRRRQVLKPIAELAAAFVKKLMQLRWRNPRCWQIVVIDAERVAAVCFGCGKGTGLALAQFTNCCLDKLILQDSCRLVALCARVHVCTGHGFFDQPNGFVPVSEQERGSLKEFGRCVLYQCVATTVISHRVSSDSYFYPHGTASPESNRTELAAFLQLFHIRDRAPVYSRLCTLAI